MPKHLTPTLAVSSQLTLEDVRKAADEGYRSIICNRPDGEETAQPNAKAIGAAATALGLQFTHIPVTSGKITDEDVTAMETALNAMNGPVLAYCRSGTRSAMLWALSATKERDPEQILEIGRLAGYDLGSIRNKLITRNSGRNGAVGKASVYDVVVIGGGAAGIATATSLLSRRADLKVAIVEPAEYHYYQPGWTLVGRGVFSAEQTKRRMADVLPRRATWIRMSSIGFLPDDNSIVLENGRRVQYDVLVVAPGLKLDWGAIPGLSETLGKNRVTSNYRYDLAPYTWELVQNLKQGRALFTQPPMPIKCAGAPQKAMYLSCDEWLRSGRLDDVKVEFHNAGAVLFGVPTYVPPLMGYVDRYGIDLRFESKLIAVDGPRRVATFERKRPDGQTSVAHESFDMLHVCPPQTAPDFVRESPLAAASGWVDVDQWTLQHARFANIFSLGDVCSAPNAKTAAAVRKQAPVVAVNVLDVLEGRAPSAGYDGYGSCPLTVEKGKVILAEFGYGGRLLPSFPQWVVNGAKPSRLSWILKERMLPPIYWKGMLKGHEWLAHPQPVEQVKMKAEAQP
ncbi:TIGR01244 family phosphatase [Sphingomonas parva]|uniref:TIGR01244 family phosphatase n=1 Tax=Sphingomonas parva TaxID=2555898 RepID=A0A4Y8ZUP4_9SPHN|nr:bifunctional protein tyrosine phosphatase family protein/NAD(P)/FAD-dependent oxidoreductase [Sphingomonas parva]TFI59738.1 TIGR01244 family phosphatase [Sphingomonas parva]